MIRLTLDTSVLLAFFKGEEEAPHVRLIMEKCEEGAVEGLISTLVLSEVYYILARRDVKRAEERFTQLERSILSKIDINRRVAKKTGELKARYGGVSIVDCAIAATAVLTGADYIIVSEKDVKHFKGISEINVKSPKEGVTILPT